MNPLADHSRALLAVDFENIYYYFRKHMRDKTECLTASIESLRSLRDHLRQELKQDPVVLFAYADFDRLADYEDNVQTQLYLLGYETRNVLGTDHKNAADMQLCIDLMAILYTRRDVDSFVIVAGDRDYIPVVRHLSTQGRHIIVASFKEAMSGDLIEVLTEERFLELNQLHDTDRWALKDRQEIEREDALRSVEKHKEAAERVARMQPLPVEPPKEFSVVRTSKDPVVLEALSVMLKDFGDKPEVWVTPFLHKLRTDMSQLAEYERKNLINDMTMIGAVKVEKRHGFKNGEPVEYSVMLVNWDHPQIREMNGAEF
ncbi:MAG: NYN domain-containing protein [Fimbriimonadaceae bacterium]|nr:NYN domain-containing protein [Fimbriimonadaceae bacterium]